MASDKAYLQFILDQLEGLEGLTYRAMMGEYVLYLRGKVIGGVYDDRLLLKPSPSALRLLEAEGIPPQYDIPYPGAKELLVAPVDERDLLCRLAEAVAEDLPESKKRG